jgi:hypothetical protein
MRSWYVQLDSSGYIVDITSIAPLLEGYIMVETDVEPPSMIMRGYYKWDNGFVVDAAKQLEMDTYYDNLAS